MRAHRTTSRTLHRAPIAALVALALAVPSAAAAYEKAFAANSLIIPTQAEYQTDCGTISAYGLVYMLLWRNEARRAADKKPITVYWAIEPKKLSHHRCNTGGWSSNGTFVSNETLPDYTSYNDNDGCDFVVQSDTGRPVGLLQNDGTVANDFRVTTTNYNSSTGELTRDNQSCLRSAPTGRCTTIGTNSRVVKYSGGLWIIDATDRAAVMEELHTALNDYTNNPMWQFRDGGACTGIPVSGASGTSHHVNIHVANIGFRAPVARMMNDKPARIALLGARFVGILENYLQNAGLAGLPNAAGTPATPGVIYDVLEPLTDFIDATYPDGGALALTDASGKRQYQVLWAPHWEEGGWNPDVVPPPVGVYSGTATQIANQYRLDAFTNIAKFVDAGYGVFLECASIASHEGSMSVGQAICSNTYTCLCHDAALCTLNTTQPFSCTTGSNCDGSCLVCPVGTTMSQPCDRARCLTAGSECATGYTYRASDNTCWRCTNSNFPTLNTSRTTPRCYGSWSNWIAATAGTLQGPLATAGVSTCGAGYAGACDVNAGSVELQGWDPVRFQMNKRIIKNGISGDGSWGGEHRVPDCTDRSTPPGSKYYNTAATTALCIDFHPTEGGPGNMFSQKGNSIYSGDIGHTSYWKPAQVAGSFYGSHTFRFATTKSGTTQDDGWDFITARHKDGDPTKGMVVYLGGHDLSSDPAGNRVVLNTMLNLGFSEGGDELARSEPVGYVTWDRTVNPPTKKETVFQGTYVQRQPPGPYQDWINYNPTAPHSWRFPYIDGHMRAYNLASIDATAVQKFSQNMLWDAASRMPAPADRTIFTVVGGSGNSGWRRINFRYTETDPATPCASYRSASNADVCHLSAKLAEGNTAGVTLSTLEAGNANASLLGKFVSQVRGFCAPSGAGLEPASLDDCANTSSQWQKNTARLGGVDHSSPAIVGPSPYVKDTAAIAYSQRPVVAYFGGRDGMLHAAYVSGAAWTGKKRNIALNPDDHGGTELWAFIPPGQLRSLSTNAAMVDANVSVMDVFGAFPYDRNNDGAFDLSTGSNELPDGKREWRTILVATAGEGAAEIFALDVTDPLWPVLLWRVSGFDNRTSTFSTNDQATYALRWPNSRTTDYSVTPATAAESYKTGRYDYRNLGYAFGTAMGTLWAGNAFRWMLYVATSTADWTDATTPLGFRGLEVFAIDVVTGKKEWQWQNRYTIQNADDIIIADNGIPGRPALVDVNGDGSVDRVYVGDLEGHLWELAAETGKNLNYLEDSSASTAERRRSFPLWGTPPMTDTGVSTSIQRAFRPGSSSTGPLAQQPLTSPIGIGRFTVVPESLEPYLKERIAVAQGTMGVDWSIAPQQVGHVYALPAYPEWGSNAVSLLSSTMANTRLTPPIDGEAARNPYLRGVILPAAEWDTVLGQGERVYGMPKIMNNTMYVNTSFGTFTGDLSSSMADAGRTIGVTTGTDRNALVREIDTGQKRFGGVLIFGTNLVITSDTGMIRKPDEVSSAAASNKVRSRFTPTAPKSWEQRPDGNPPFVR